MQIFKLLKDDLWSTGLKVILRREQSRLIFLCKFLVISPDSFQIDSRDGDSGKNRNQSPKVPISRRKKKSQFLVIVP